MSAPATNEAIKQLALLNVSFKCVAKYHYQFDALYGYFVDWKLVSSAQTSNIGNSVKIQWKLISTSMVTKTI